MGVIYIKARIACDRCGIRFDVHLDPAETPPAGWSLWDSVNDTVRGGVGGDDPLNGSSVEGDDMLCGRCTKIALVAAETKEGSRV